MAVSTAAARSTTHKAAAAACTKAQVEARKVKIQILDVNEHLTCALCHGYFRDAHKIKECAHTFCSSCIRSYFSRGKGYNTCPTCKTYLGGLPMTMILADPVLQGIVDKLLPAFAAREEVERRAFYEQHGFKPKAGQINHQTAATAPTKSVAGSGNDAVPGKEKMESPTKPVEKIAFEMHPQNGPDIPLFLHLEKLKQPKMATDATYRIHFIRKYVALKLRLSDPSKVEILCKGVPVGGDYSLAFVRRTIWDDPEKKMILEYRGTAV